MVDYALIIGLVVVAAMSTLSHVSDLSTGSFDILSHTFQEAERAYQEEVLNLQNSQTIAEYASVANGTASAGVAQSWAGSTVFGQDNIGSPDDYMSGGDSETGTTVGGGTDTENRPPIARFGFYNDIRPALGKTFKLLNSSYDEDGDRIAKAEWSGKPSENMFKSAGTYTIKLRVADEHGAWSDWYEETFVIENEDPIAVITKDTEFAVLDEENRDLAVDENMFYLMGKANTTLNLYDDASYDPDGHPLVTSYWTTSIDDQIERITDDFGKGLTITKNKSGPVTVALRVEDKYEGVSEEVSTSFYYFASERPELRNITFSDGSNNQYTIESLTPEDWIAELYPYTGETTLQIPVSNNKTRINFQVEDDSNAVTSFQYKFNGSISDEIPLHVTSSENNYFYLAALTENFIGKTGLANLSFRVKDESDTWSKWTEEIPVTFLSISEIHPVIKDFYIENYSTYDQQVIPSDTGTYFKGSFKGTIKIDDIYGNMRSLETLDLTLNGSSLEYTNLTKVSGTTYTFEFEIDSELSNATMTVQGFYDNSDQTDVAQLDGINVQEYTINLTSATLFNKALPDWWLVDLTKTGNETVNQISGVNQDLTNGNYQINVIYSSIFNAPITSAEIVARNDSSSPQMVTATNIEAQSNQELIITIPANELDAILSKDTFDYLFLQLRDERGNTSNEAIETGTIVKLIDINTYVPTLFDYKITDGEKNTGKADRNYSRGEIDVEFTVEDFFYRVRPEEQQNSFVYSSISESTGIAYGIGDKSVDKTQKLITTNYTFDTHNWSAWENGNEATLSTEFIYVQNILISPNINLLNYSPNTISSIEYKTNKFSGQYTIVVDYTNYSEFFEIDEIHFTLYIDGQDPIEEIINIEDCTITSDGKIIFSHDRLPSRVDVTAKAYLTHTNNVGNSNEKQTHIFIEKPYEIEIAEIEHREPSTTTDGFTKMFTGKSMIDSRTDDKLIQQISVENSEEENAPISEISMTHTSPTKGQTVYATYNKIGISPTGSIVFSNSSLGLNDMKKYLVNTTASGKSATSVLDDDYAYNMFTIFTGDIVFDNSPGSGSGIYYKTNTHYVDDTNRNNKNSTTIKYINMCTPSNWNAEGKICTEPFSIEATIYDNGSARIHYSTLPEELINSSLIGGRIDEETSDVFDATAFGQYDEEFSAKSLRFNTLPPYYLIPPTIIDVEYGQSKSSTEATIDPQTSETILAEYIIYYDNPENVPIIVHDGSLSQQIFGETEPTSRKIQAHGTVIDSGSMYKFDSKNVIRRTSTNATIMLRLQYSEDPDYYTGYFVKNNVKYVGPVMIDFVATVPPHVEPNNDITGYTPIDFTSGYGGNCGLNSWSENSNDYYDDCSSKLYPLGFEMAYINGERVTEFSVSTNSLLRFDKIVQTGYSPQPVTGLEDDTLAILWYDQAFRRTSTNPSNPAGIFYKQFLDAPIPYVSVKYLQLIAYSDGVEPFNYEVQIYQDGRIIVHYSKEVPVRLDEDGTTVRTTTAFKKTMLSGYGSLILPDGELDSQLDFVSTRKLLGYNEGDPNAYIGMSSVGKSIQIDLNKCNSLDGTCGSYVPSTQNPNSMIYRCENDTQTVTLNAGTYKLQAWGAQGNKADTTNTYSASPSQYVGGKGGYAEGTIKLGERTTLYLNVGCQGEYYEGGFNGGGNASSLYNGSIYYAGGGGGASDIRILSNKLEHRLIVAGGGGGASMEANGGAGGGIEGLSVSGSNNGLGGSPEHSTKPTIGTIAFPGSFGKGGNQIGTTQETVGGAGGGGYYGGGAGKNKGSGGGGSSYVYDLGNIANISIINGMSEMPTTDNSGTKVGQNGDGIIIITPITDNSVSTFDKNLFEEHTKDLKELYVESSNFDLGETKKFPYQASTQTVTLDPGTYKIQAWGAQGGYKSSSYRGGKGGYTEGYITVSETITAYINTGGAGSNASTSSNVSGGYNGGGSAVKNSASGGGGTDIRLFYNDLANRVIVAGGGGAGSSTKAGGAGGGLSGLDGTGTYFGTGGTQETGGITTGYTDACATAGTFGTGASYSCSTSTNGAAGGGGYYGGGAGVETASAGGGSSFIHEKVKEGRTIAGNASMPSPTSSSTITGKDSSGYAIITKVTNDTYDAITVDEFADFKIGEVRTYNATGSEQTVTLDPGTYKIQVWGAQGGYKSSSYPGGKGGYIEGIINLNNTTNAYIYVGTAGQNATSSNVTGGYNGGGSATSGNASGGGASDIRLNNSSSANKILIAGGGGAGGSSGIGGAGGNINGVNGSGTHYGLGGSQTSGGTTYNNTDSCNGSGASGTGANYSCSTNGGAGGGGYYGGGAGTNNSGGGGGSSFATTTVQNVVTIPGNAYMPSPSGGSEQLGQSGDGIVVITRLPNNSGGFIVGTSKLYEYNNGTYIENLPAGLYELKVWGAQGGESSGITFGGKGGYTNAQLRLSSEKQIALTVGGKGSDAGSSFALGGYNGGGQGTAGGGGGGGASDIRMDGFALSNRIIVAGGGGGAAYAGAQRQGNGGAGGGLTGSDGTSITADYQGVGGSQSAGGIPAKMYASDEEKYGSLGQGGTITSNNTSFYYKGGGGGGGYYGGSAGGGYAAGGGGGSSYHDSTKLISPSTVSGNTTQPSPLINGTQEGNAGNGYIYILRIE